jgi:hypothetical protein
VARGEPFRETLANAYYLRDDFDARTYPAPRTKRAGPPPSAQSTGLDALAPRTAPIRGRPFAFHARELSGRVLLPLGSYVGPGLVKRLDILVYTSGNNNPQPHVNLFWDTTAYVAAAGLALDTLPKGVPLLESILLDDQGFPSSQEGGLDTLGVQALGSNHLLDYYIGEQNFFVALAFRNDGAVQGHITGTLLTYEGVVPSDFPAILG